MNGRAMNHRRRAAALLALGVAGAPACTAYQVPPEGRPPVAGAAVRLEAPSGAAPFVLRGDTPNGPAAAAECRAVLAEGELRAAAGDTLWLRPLTWVQPAAPGQAGCEVLGPAAFVVRAAEARLTARRFSRRRTAVLAAAAGAVVAFAAYAASQLEIAPSGGCVLC